MKKILFTVSMACICLFTSNLKAQVTIGNNNTPDVNAILDLQSNTNKGLLLPRVALTATNNPSPTSAHTAGMTVYNTATTSVNNGYDVSPGFYYNDGTKWVQLPLGYTKWFYMPSVSFDTSTTGTGRSKDLYGLYYAQFHAPTVKSTGAPTSVPYIAAATDMYYYITSYDNTVFANVSINASGVMTYDVIGSATACSFINIAFVLK
ncbi:MAG: hypothetical protein WCG93_12305 [Paludibacter sp.]